jgi:hypothetical protein
MLTDKVVSGQVDFAILEQEVFDEQDTNSTHVFNLKILK